jgi:adenosylcobinamide-phosphate guanylyltransferase
MCGGRGTRLDADREKPLVPVAGRPMVDRVRDALAAARIDRIHAVVSPHTPDTRAHLADADAGALSLVDAPGEGYVADLGHALDAVGRPALTVAADLPLLAPGPVDRALAAARVADPDRPPADPDRPPADPDRPPADPARGVAVHVPAALKRRLGASLDTTVAHEGRTLAPAGLNVVADGPDRIRISHDARLAVNVNRPADRSLAEALAPC